MLTDLVSSSWGRKFVKAGDEIIISALEHHSNIVPWQILCEEKGARLRVVPINDNGEFLFDEYEKLLGPRPVADPLDLLEKNADVAAQEVRNKVDLVVNDLPETAEIPIVQKLDTDATPVLRIAVSAPRSLRDVTDIADKQIKRQIEPISGVGNVDIVGRQQSNGIQRSKHGC